MHPEISILVNFLFILSLSEFSLIGLALIALGTGGIKPCVSAFGGDQFNLPEQEKQLKVTNSFELFIDETLHLG